MERHEKTLNSLWILALILFWHKRLLFNIFRSAYFNSLSIPLWKCFLKLYFLNNCEYETLSWRLKTVFSPLLLISQENIIIFTVDSTLEGINNYPLILLNLLIFIINWFAVKIQRFKFSHCWLDKTVYLKGLLF